MPWLQGYAFARPMNAKILPLSSSSGGGEPLDRDPDPAFGGGLYRRRLFLLLRLGSRPENSHKNICLPADYANARTSSATPSGRQTRGTEVPTSNTLGRRQNDRIRRRNCFSVSFLSPSREASLHLPSVRSARCDFPGSQVRSRLLLPGDRGLYPYVASARPPLPDSTGSQLGLNFTLRMERLRLLFSGADHGDRRSRRALCPATIWPRRTPVPAFRAVPRLHGSIAGRRPFRQPHSARRLLGADQHRLLPADRHCTITHTPATAPAWR